MVGLAADLLVPTSNQNPEIALRVRNRFDRWALVRMLVRLPSDPAARKRALHWLARTNVAHTCLFQNVTVNSEVDAAKF